MKINTISVFDPCFAGRLEHIPSAPKTLFALGNPSVVGPAVAIVGTRKPTPYGKAVTLELAEKLARRGVVIVSGLALGIDCIAQTAAVDAGGRTVAVLASGLDQITPHSNRAIALKILRKDGGLLSENEPGTPPFQWEFLKRNRIVSGLANAVIVTEATAKSGTMNTVMHALSQGRDVYAVPGSILSPTSAGCNRLIEQGATPIVDIDAFVEHIAPLKKQSKQQLLLAQTPEEQTLLDLIQSGISDGDELQKAARQDAITFATTLTMLELRGAIHALGANQWGL